jgi:outer membrane receptor protein involved in Fe transport
MPNDIPATPPSAACSTVRRDADGLTRRPPRNESSSVAAYAFAPRQKLRLIPTYDRGKFGVGLNWRYLPEQKDLSLVQTPTFTALPTKAYNVFNANASWRLSDRIRIRGGIDNVLNTDPRIVGANPNAVNNPTANLGVTNAGDYDVLGRRAYVGINLSF